MGMLSGFRRNAWRDKKLTREGLEKARAEIASNPVLRGLKEEEYTFAFRNGANSQNAGGISKKEGMSELGKDLNLAKYNPFVVEPEMLVNNMVNLRMSGLLSKDELRSLFNKHVHPNDKYREKIEMLLKESEHICDEIKLGHKILKRTGRLLTVGQAKNKKKLMKERAEMEEFFKRLDEKRNKK
jgi:hypothetical protein